MRHPRSAAALAISALLLALGACSTAPPAAPPVPPAAATAATAPAAYGRITDITAEPTQTLYQVKLPDGSQRKVRSAQPFPIGACVELLSDAGVRESTHCR